DRLFRQSGLMRDKWDEQRGAQTYGARTIAEALARQEQHYTPRQQTHQRRNGHTLPGVPADPPGHAVPPDAGYPYSDAYNACALVQAHGQHLRYCASWKSWLTWTGTHWQRDTASLVLRWQRQTVKALGAQLPALRDTAAKALLGHIKSSLNTTRLKAAVEQAQ